MHRLPLLGLLSLFSLAATLSGGELDAQRLHNWHQWRGPLATGVAPHGDPPLKWDAETHIAWKAPLPGEGSSTPVVWGDQVFVLAAVDTRRKAEDPPEADPRAKTRPPGTYFRFQVLCFDRNTGKPLWERTAVEAVPHEGHHPTHSYAAFSPTTDGERLYVSFGSRGVFCFDLQGNPRWQRDLGDMRTRYGWGEAASPVVHGQTLLLNWDHEDDSFIAALNAETGETRWQVPRDEPTSWATPLVVEHEGRTLAVVNGTNRVRAYDLSSGEVVWECGGQSVNAIPSPVAAAGVVYCMTGYRGYAAFAIPLGSRGDVTGSETLPWSFHRGTPYVPSPALIDGRLYFTRANSSVLTCLDAASGEPLIDGERLAGLSSMYASPVVAAGRIYFTDRDGTTQVIAAEGKLRVLATNELDDPIDASPAIVGRQLFLRSAGALYCIEKP